MTETQRKFRCTTFGPEVEKELADGFDYLRDGPADIQQALVDTGHMSDDRPVEDQITEHLETGQTRPMALGERIAYLKGEIIRLEDMVYPDNLYEARHVCIRALKKHVDMLKNGIIE